MNDAAANVPLGTTAGGLLRAAREKQGLHIAALAASIKVTPRKLDALEHDRYDELPDATFTRALAQTVCRSLKIDPRPVLDLLPHAEAPALDHVTGTLNMPFRDRPGREAPGGLAVAAIRPLVWAGGALLVAAVLVYFLPSSLWQAVSERTPAPMAATSASSATSAAAAATVAASAAPAASAAVVVADAAPSVAGLASAAASAAAAVVVAVPSAPSAPSVPAATVAPPVVAVAPAPQPPPSAPAGAQLVRLQASDASWIEARDASGQVLLSRVLQPSESVGVNGALPIKLTIGNAQATRLSFRGKPVDLASSTRDNVARLELQ
jgi:cytoskeleton protein RodZ